jgi:hypothetical protein
MQIALKNELNQLTLSTTVTRLDRQRPRKWADAGAIKVTYDQIAAVIR